MMLTEITCYMLAQRYTEVNNLLLDGFFFGTLKGILIDDTKSLLKA